jgi:hypothetical protein
VRMTLSLLSALFGLHPLWTVASNSEEGGPMDARISTFFIHFYWLSLHPNGLDWVNN